MLSSRTLLLAAAACLFCLGPASAERQPRAGQALAQLDAAAAAGPKGGLVMERRPSRPNLTVDATRPLGTATAQDPAKGPASSRKDFVPDPEELKEAMVDEECSSFGSCLVSAVWTPITLPFQGAAFAGVLGSQIASEIAGVPGAVFGAILGGLLGLIAGVILAPIAAVGGLFQAAKKL